MIMFTYNIKYIGTVLIMLFSFAVQPGYAQATKSTHTVKPGETLYAISKMYGISIDEIKAQNPEASTSLKAGMQLTIPTPGNNCIFYTIQPKETLYSIAKKYGIEQSKITNSNPGLSESNFRTGTTIKIPVSRFIETTVDTTARKPMGIAGTNCREIYKTGKGETIGDIAKDYGISQEELIAANPEIKNKVGKKLSKGTFLCIPFPATPVNTCKIGATATQNGERETVLKKKKTYNIVLLMPFYTDGNKSIDFYRGMLYAIEEFKKTGISFNIRAYNAGQSTTDISKILSDANIGKADAIISCGSEAVSNIVSEYCQSKKIKMLLPFSKAFDAVYNNPYVVLFNMPQSYESAAYTNFFFDTLPANANIVYFECLKQSNLSKSILKELELRKIKYNVIGAFSETTDFLKSFKSGVKNFIFLSSPLKTDYEALYSKLEKNSASLAGIDFTIFGYDEWKDFDSSTRNTFFNYGVTICTPQFINVYASKYASIRMFYKDTFKKTPSTNSQRAFFSGYDCANHLFGENASSVSIPFALKRVNTWGGLINEGVRVVNFTKKHTTVISDHEN